MKTPPGKFLIWSTILIALLSAAGFAGAWFLDRKEIALAILSGAGIGWLELESTVWIFPRLMASRSRMVWGLLMAGKSLLIFSAIGFLLLGLKVSGFGFIIGFSAVVLSILLTAAWLKPGPEGKGDERISDHS